VRKRNILDIIKIIIACSLIIFSSLTAYAVPKETAAVKTVERTQALKAYKKKLKKSKVVVLPKGKWFSKSYDSRLIRYKNTKSSKVRFALANINNDDIPELILKDPRFGYAVFTYKKGKIICLKYGNSYDQPKSYYTGTGIFLEKAGSEGTPHTLIYYKMTGAKMKKVMDIFYIEAEPTYYEIGKKHVSELKFMKKLNGYKGDSVPEKIVFRKNTKANRKKYMK